MNSPQEKPKVPLADIPFHYADVGKANEEFLMVTINLAIRMKSA